MLKEQFDGADVFVCLLCVPVDWFMLSSNKTTLKIHVANPTVSAKDGCRDKKVRIQFPCCAFHPGCNIPQLKNMSLAQQDA